MEKIKKNKKKILVGVLAILIVLSFILFKWYKYYEDTKFENENWLSKHISLEENSDGVYEVKTDEEISIFNLAYQNVIEDKIESLKNEDSYSLTSPLIIYNPYGTGSLSYYVYLGSSYDDLSYTVKTEGYADYSHDLGSNEEYQIVGLVPGEKNTLTLTSGDDKFSKEIKAPKIKSDVDVQIEKTDGDSTNALTDGLYAVLGHDKNYEANVYLYDNEGVLRNELVLESYRADRIVFDGDDMYYPYKSKGIIKVNGLGKIERIYDLGNYSMHHDMVLDDDKLVILADKDGEDTKEDLVITLDLNSSSVEEVADMKDLLPELYEKATLPKDSTKLDWLHLNSLSVNGDDLILSGRELSMVIYLSDYEENPKVKYLLADESMVEGTSYTDLLYTKANDFVSNAGQHAVTYIDGEDEYYLIMFNNNYGSIETRPDFEWTNYPSVGTFDEGEASYFYKYKINEDEKSYELVESLEVPYSSIVSSVQIYDDNLVVGSGKNHTFGEYDDEGNLINQFEYEAKKYAYRVFKYSFDNWFK